MKTVILALVLAATMSGCIHRTSSRPKMAPAFPVVTTPLPQGADAWVCESKNGDSFQVCDAVVLANGIDSPGPHGSVGEEYQSFIRVAFQPEQVESLNGYIRIDQPNGLVVYWRARMMQ